jgi:hypothetical protein
MRRRWEDDENLDDNLDEPVTITGRQLRSLKRGARVGLFGILLAFVAIGLATWNLLSSTRGAANNDMNPSPATAAPADMETATPGAPTATAGAPAATPQPVQPSVPAPAQTTASPATAAAPAPAEIRPASATRSHSSTKAASVRRGRMATAKVTARNAVSTPSASGRQPERGVPIEMPSPTLTAPSLTPAPAAKTAAPAAKAPAAKAAAPTDSAKGN